MTYDGAQSPDPLRIIPDDDAVRLGCQWCDATTVVALEPTPALLSTIDAFAVAHARCAETGSMSSRTDASASC